tara:strand:- start:123 stop:362 length:240 start_codon:yes stop_codon:yes gene_type:complete
VIILGRVIACDLHRINLKTKGETMRYECVISVKCNPVREANSKEEFIKNLIAEYNSKCESLFEINRSDISKIICEEEQA